MKLFIKHFAELSNKELLDIIRLRISVFVVEQKCAYQEVDEYDDKAIHLYLKDNDEIVAYARVLPKGCTYDEVSIGRVISIRRKMGLGTRIVKEAIEIARKEFDASSIKIGAQVYVKKMYEDCGFVGISDEYLEDGIPHMDMLLTLKG